MDDTDGYWEVAGAVDFTVEEFVVEQVGVGEVKFNLADVSRESILR